MYILTNYSRNCDLYEEKEKDTTDWRKRLDQLEAKNRRRAQSQPVGSTVKCPKCRLKIYKVIMNPIFSICNLSLLHLTNGPTCIQADEKYIFCWVCQASYCTLCKKDVQFSGFRSEHWGSPQCVGIKF